MLDVPAQFSVNVGDNKELDEHAKEGVDKGAAGLAWGPPLPRAPAVFGPRLELVWQFGEGVVACGAFRLSTIGV